MSEDVKNMQAGDLNTARAFLRSLGYRFAVKYDDCEYFTDRKASRPPVILRTKSTKTGQSYQFFCLVQQPTPEGTLKVVEHILNGTAEIVLNKEKAKK